MLKFSGGGIVPGVSRAEQVTGDNQLPQEVEVVVIGGGLVGCVTVLNLAERGVSVVLCEKGAIAGEASGRASGLIEYERLAPIKMEIIARSMELWRDMPARIDSDIGYLGEGLITLFEDEARAESAVSWISMVQGLPGMEARMLSPNEIQTLDSALGNNWYSGLYQANGAAIEPRLAAPAIANAARNKGAKIFLGCAVRCVERQAGKIASVVTEKGEIKTPNVVIAGGVWSSMIAKQLQLDLPQLMIFAEQISVEPLDNGPVIAGMTPAGYFRPEPDGGYMFGTVSGVIPLTPTIFKNLRKLISMPTEVDQEMFPVISLSTFIRELKGAGKPQNNSLSVFEKHRIFQPKVIGNTSTKTFEGMRKYIPAFHNSKIRERYAGSLMTSLDNLGVISSVESIPGLYLGTGMLYGLTMSAAAGEVLADLITGNKPKVDVIPYRYERFIDGSDFVFYP